MMRRLHRWLLLGLALCCLLSGCAGRQKKIFETDGSQVALRNMQSRVFETNDRTNLLRTVISTLQDLGFVIDKADNELGSVSGTKRSGYSLRMTVSVRPKGEDSSIVRCNAQYGLQLVEDPEPYQRFFEALSKALFLDAQLISEESTLESAPPQDIPEKTTERQHTDQVTVEGSLTSYRELFPYGTAPSKVKEILGVPSQTLTFENGESWYYPERKVKILIYEGHVLSVDPISE